jgi:hypothetical protein
MSGHRHNPNAGTQNQGNSLGDRSSVRQSKLYRQYESGNDVKAILGCAHLGWNPNEKEGGYKGQKVYDHLADPNTRPEWMGRNENTNYGNNNNSGHSSSRGPSASYENASNYNNSSRGAPAETNYGRHHPSSQTRSQAPYARDEDDSNSLAKYTNRSGYGSKQSEPEPDYRYGNDYSQPPKRESYAPAENNYRRRPADDEDEEEVAAAAAYGGNNTYRKKSFGTGGGGGDSAFPLNKMKGDEYQTYRDHQNPQSQAASQYQSSSSFQTTRARSSEKAAEGAAKSYFQQSSAPVATGREDRSTRPW